MKIIVATAILIGLTLSCGGMTGRYELEVQLSQGQVIRCFTTLTDQNGLERNFNSDLLFKNYVCRLTDDHDSLDLYSNYHHLDYPAYRGIDEPLACILFEDRFKLAKSDIRSMRFISFDELSVSLVTQI